jgi:hypothetical protein
MKFKLKEAVPPGVADPEDNASDPGCPKTDPTSTNRKVKTYPIRHRNRCAILNPRQFSITSIGL